MVHEAKSKEEEHPLFDVTKKVRRLLNDYQHLTIVLMSPAHGFVGEQADPDEPNTLFKVAALALAPHSGGLQGPQGAMSLALNVNTIVGSSKGLIGRMEMGTMLPKYRVAHLVPEDAAVVLDLYGQIREKAEAAEVPEEVWNRAGDPED